ncbi:NLP3-like protein [Tanacetum coccineum]
MIKSDSVLKTNQTDVVIHASDRIATPVLGTSIKPSGPTNIYVHVILTKHDNQSSTLVRHNEEQTNLLDGSAQLKTTIGKQYTKTTSAGNIATYKENTVKIPFSISDGLVKLEELVTMRFKLSPGCLRLKYADADGDMILIARDNDLMGSAGDSRQPGHQTLIRLLVSSSLHQLLASWYNDAKSKS